VGLKVKIRCDLLGIVQKHLIHWCFFSPEMFRTDQDLNLREFFIDTIHHYLTIGVDNDYRDLRA
jgi:hypothetical protein